MCSHYHFREAAVGVERKAHDSHEASIKVAQFPLVFLLFLSCIIQMLKYFQMPGKLMHTFTEAVQIRHALKDPILYMER